MNLAADPAHAERLKSMRIELDMWMKSQGDTRSIFAESRLLSDPSSYGPTAPPGSAAAPAANAKKKK